MNKSLFTRDELQDLRKEFIEFKINEMTTEDMASYLYDIMINDVSILNEEELRDEIDDYEKLCVWGDGDSLDRERVRDILLDEFNLEVKEWA